MLMESFFHYMFAPQGQPWYTGAFWSNQVQWTLVTLPSLIGIVVRMEVHHKRHMQELKKLRDK